MTEFLEKLKNHYFWPFRAHFAHFWVKMNFLKTLGCKFLDVPVIHHHAKKSTKLAGGYDAVVSSNFIGLSIYRGPVILIKRI